MQIQLSDCEIEWNKRGKNRKKRRWERKMWNELQSEKSQMRDFSGESRIWCLDVNVFLTPFPILSLQHWLSNSILSYTERYMCKQEFDDNVWYMVCARTPYRICSCFFHSLLSKQQLRQKHLLTQSSDKPTNQSNQNATHNKLRSYIRRQSRSGFLRWSNDTRPRPPNFGQGKKRPR